MQSQEISQMRFKAPIALAIAATALLAITSANAQTVKFGNLIATIDGGITPTKLPKTKPAPITLNLSGALKTADGTHVPPLKTLSLEFDRHGYLNTKGLPTCPTGKLQSTLTAQAKKACGDALIGTGHVTAEIALPEQAPFSAGGPLLIFNSTPKGKNPVLALHVFAHVPAPTTFVTTAEIGKAHGKYGTSAFIRVPTIVAGQGSLTSFKATLHKTWTYKGQKQNLLLATCPTGRLFAHGDFTFSEGSKLSGNVIRSCTPAK
jgi:hypothetical protein